MCIPEIDRHKSTKILQYNVPLNREYLAVNWAKELFPERLQKMKNVASFQLSETIYSIYSGFDISLLWCNGFYIEFRPSFAKETFSYDEHLKS